MEIHGNGRANELARLLFGTQDSIREGKRVGTSGSDSGNEPQRADSVSISSAGKAFHEEFQLIKQLTQGVDDARLERVEQLRQAVNSNTYNVPGQPVADAVIRATLDEFISS